MFVNRHPSARRSIPEVNKIAASSSAAQRAVSDFGGVALGAVRRAVSAPLAPTRTSTLAKRGAKDVAEQSRERDAHERPRAATAPRTPGNFFSHARIDDDRHGAESGKAQNTDAMSGRPCRTMTSVRFARGGCGAGGRAGPGGDLGVGSAKVSVR